MSGKKYRSRSRRPRGVRVEPEPLRQTGDREKWWEWAEDEWDEMPSPEEWAAATLYNLSKGQDSSPQEESTREPSIPLHLLRMLLNS